MKIISKNLEQINVTTRGLKKYIKDDPWVMEAGSLIDESLQRIRVLSTKINIIKENGNDLWIRASRIKNGMMKMVPSELDAWEEIVELKDAARSISPHDKIKKDNSIKVFFLDLDQYLRDQVEDSGIYYDLMMILSGCGVIEFEYDRDYRYDEIIISNLHDMLEERVRMMINEHFSDEMGEAREFQERDDQHDDFSGMFINAFFSTFIQYYINNIEKTHQESIQ